MGLNRNIKALFKTFNLMKVAFTGHRPNKLGHDYVLNSPLIQWIKVEILKLLNIDEITPPAKDLHIITGMALGIDTLAALTAIQYNIPFTAAIPFVDQEKMWSNYHQHLYNSILAKAQVKEIVSEGNYAAWKMQARNNWMVDHSDVLIAVWDGTDGGTANCINYAKKKEKQIYYINPKNYYNGNNNKYSI